MVEVLFIVAGVVGVFAAGFFALRFATAPNEQRRHWLASGMFYAATLSPIAVTLLSPRTGTGAGFTEFSDAPQGAAVSFIIRAVGYFFVVAVPLLILVRLKSSLAIPGTALALLAYAVIGWVSSLVNEQPVSVDLFYPALVVTGVLAASSVSPPQALRMSRVSLRLYVWLSLALAVVAPGLAFWEGQGRTWFGVSQLAGVTTHPNGMGTIAALAMMVELVRLEGVKRPRVWHVLAAVVALLATQSRGAWLSAAIGLVIYLVFRSGARFLIASIPVLMLAGLAVSTFVREVADALVHWSAGGDIATLNGRTTIWANALEAVQHSPIFGTGPRSFDLEYRSKLLGLGDLISSSNAHNQFVQTLVERGVLGLLVLAVLLVILFRKALGSPARAGLLAVLATFVSRFVVETPLNISTVSLNGAALVIVVVLISAATKEAPAGMTMKSTPRAAKLPEAYRRAGYEPAMPKVMNVVRR